MCAFDGPIFDFDFLGREWTEFDKNNFNNVVVIIYRCINNVNECSRQEVWSLYKNKSDFMVHEVAITSCVGIACFENDFISFFVDISRTMITIT